MRDQPDPSALLAIVAETLRADVIPNLTGAAAHQARIAASLVMIVGRALDRGPADDAAELGRLRDLLGRTDGDLKTLTADLAGRLRDGSATFDDPAVAAHLHATTLAKMAVDQPGYARYRQVTGA